MRNIILACIFTIFVVKVSGKIYSPTTTTTQSNRILSELSKSSAPLSFVENKGQVNDQNRRQRNDIQFEIAAGPGLNIFIGDGAIHYQFSKPDEVANTIGTDAADELPGLARIKHLQATYTMYRMDVELIGANKNARVVKEDKLDHYENYFTSSTGRYTVADAFSKVIYKDIYPNIDWVLYTSHGQLKHEFVVRAGGKVSDIKLKYGGAVDLRLNTDGALTATTPQGVITEQAPNTYQVGGTTIASSFNLNGDIISYSVGAHTGSIVIDPVLIWGTYYGGTGSEDAYSTATDNAGNIYICGYTSSTLAIATSGAYQVTYGGSTDAYLAKFNKTGTLLWATYYGGSSDDYGRSVATDATGNVYMAGSTSSTTAIATPGAYQTTYLGGDDAFIVKFNSSGVIQWGTYYGGTNSDYAFDIALDGSGNAYITGQTMSASGIATPGTFRPTASGNYDGFVAKFNSSGALQWGSYYGGNSADYGYGVAVDGSGNVFINGYTASGSTMTTPGAYQTVLNGIYDAYLAKFDASGAIQWATYFGGNAYDYGYGVTVDGSGNPYITGYTNSTSGVATAGAYQSANAGGLDAYVAKFDHAGAIQWATYYGGSADDEGHHIGTDVSGNIYFTGMTQSLSGIATPGAYQTVLGGGIDVFLAKLNNTGTPQWATYYGGASSELPHSLAIGDSDNVYISGYTYSTSAIATPGAYQTTLSGGADAFLARFNFCNAPTVGMISGSSSVCVGGSTTLSITTTDGIWSSSSSSLATVGSTGIVTGFSAGIDTISYSVMNLCGIASATKTITVDPLPVAGTIVGLDSVCIGNYITLVVGLPGGIWTTTNGNATVIGGDVTGVTAGVDTVVYSVTNACGTDHADKIVNIVNCVLEASIIRDNAGSITLYPNPAKNSVTISSSEKINSVVIRNLLGQHVFSGQYDTKEAFIDLSQLSPGLYIVRVNNQKAYKLIKQ
jgi:Secretion system C-terminal sorting domain/Beta-propeller repeat